VSAAPLVELESVTKDFAVEGGLLRRRVGAVRALDAVSLSVREGETLGLLGESGSGKTTLGRVLLRLLAPDAGRVLWEGRPAEEFSRAEWSTRVQMVFQDPSASLNPKLCVRTLLEEAVRLRAARAGEGRLTGDAARAAAEALLAAVGLPADSLRLYPHQFSGGQKQRVAIARALALRPRLLVADEPVSALDLSIQAQILNLLSELREMYHLTVIIISHDLAVVSHLADRLAVLKDGRLVETGPTEDVLARPAHPYTALLLKSVPEVLR
jgi:peptide/nickel transport system ATP-binding protein/oligopeptide transport system ATP-binding protein